MDRVEALPDGRAHTAAVDEAVPLGAVAALWLPPVLLTLIGASRGGIVAATVLAAVVCATAHVVRPSSILVTLPFFALLSPVTGLLDMGVGRLVLSDVVFVLLAVQAVLTVIAAPRAVRPAVPVGLKVLGLLFVLCVVAGFAMGYLASLKPALYLAQLSIIAFFTARHAARDLAWLQVQRAWIVASAYGAAILLHAYGQGRSLHDLKAPDAALITGAESLLDLFRASYYYTGFHFILGLCLVWLGTRLFFPATHVQRVAILGALALIATALVATVNKTALAAVVIALVCSVGALFLRFRREMAWALFWMGGLAAAAAVVASRQSGVFADSMQLDQVIGRLSDASSLLVRLEVYVGALARWASSPWTMLLGYGPDFLDNSGNPAFALPLKTSLSTGYVEGTVDSAWLSYLIEFGLPGAVLLVALFGDGFANAWRGLRRAPAFDRGAYASASLFGGLVFLSVAMTTQMLGYSKTSWLPLQLLLVAALGVRRPQPGSG